MLTLRRHGRKVSAPLPSVLFHLMKALRAASEGPGLYDQVVRTPVWREIRLFSGPADNAARDPTPPTETLPRFRKNDSDTPATRQQTPDDLAPQQTVALKQSPVGGPIQWRPVVCDRSIDLPFEPVEKDRLSTWSHKVDPLPQLQTGIER